MMRHDLSPEQAKVLREINARVELAKKEMRTAYILVGVDPAKVAGGDLGENPHIMLAD